jgi:hypothetical protein
MRIWMRSMVLASLVLLAACGFPLDREAELAALRDARPPFVTFETLPYETLAVPSEVAFQITRASPVMEVGTLGKSFVKGFELPPDTGDVDILVHSYMVRGGRAFQPIVTMLNASKEPIVVTQYRSLQTVRFATLGPDWRRELHIRLGGGQRQQVRYLVVHTTREIIELGYALAEDPWQEARTTFIFIPVGGGPSGPPAIGSSPSGSLSLSVRPMAATP